MTIAVLAFASIVLVTVGFVIGYDIGWHKGRDVGWFQGLSVAAQTIRAIEQIKQTPPRAPDGDPKTGGAR